MRILRPWLWAMLAAASLPAPAAARPADRRPIPERDSPQPVFATEANESRAAEPEVMTGRGPATRPTGASRLSASPKSPVFALDESGIPEGPLGLPELIDLALRTDPELAELRGDVAVARAEIGAASDWKDPQLRLSAGSQRNVQLPRPYTEERRSTTIERGSATERGVNITPDDGVEPFTERSSSTMVRERDTTIRVEPGRETERISEETRERTFETEQSFERAVENTSDGRRIDTERSRSSTSSQAVSRTIEERSVPFDPLEPDEEYGMQLRIYVPNPWEQKAKVAAARANVSVQQAQLRAAEHGIVLDVREAYSDLKTAAGELAELGGIFEMRNEFLDERKRLLQSGDVTIEDVAEARSDYVRSRVDLAKAQRDYRDALLDLAELVGLDDPDRISTHSSIVPPEIDFSGLDPVFLYDLARAYRGELVELVHRGEVARHELDEYNAQRIPWLAFIDAEYGWEYNGGYRSHDEYGVQVGISIPIFTWFKNHGHEVHHEEIRSYSRQRAIAKSRVERNIDAALVRVGRAQAALHEFDQEFAELRAMIDEAISEADRMRAQGLETGFEAKESLAELKASRHDVVRELTEAVFELERAVGLEVRDIFSENPPAYQAP